MPTDYTISLEEAHHPEDFRDGQFPWGSFYSFGPDQSKADAKEVTLGPLRWRNRFGQ